MTRIVRLFVCLLTLGLAAGPLMNSAVAQDPSALNIHGFGGWAVGYTSNDNYYPDAPPPIASNDWEYDNYYFTLNLIARPTNNVVIHAQPTWESSMRGKRMQLDLAYVELMFVKDTRLRAGKIKNPLGLYTAVYKVGTLRPFYLLPTSYYRNAPEGYTGLGLNHVQQFGDWELELDMLGGQMDFEPTELDIPVGLDPVAGTPIFASLQAAVRGRDVVGGGALLRLPVKGLLFGVSAYSMKLYASAAGQPMTLIGEDRQNAFVAAVEYSTDKISLRSEGMLLRDLQKGESWYVEAAYHLDAHWQIAGSYESLIYKEPEPVIAALGKHRAFGAALNYWFSPKLAYKLNYYRVSDNRAARPDDAVNRALTGTLPKDTDVIIAGMHFSF